MKKPKLESTVIAKLAALKQQGDIKDFVVTSGSKKPTTGPRPFRHLLPKLKRKDQ